MLSFKTIGVMPIILTIILASLPAKAEYKVLFKAPKGYINKTQQFKYRARLRKEIRNYDSHEVKNVRSWHDVVMQSKATDERKRLGAIYSASHKYVRYKTERVDIWYTPAESIKRGIGDCDDFANMYVTAAYLSGSDPVGMWLVAGHTYIRSKKVGHAIAVIEGADGNQYVLDNTYGRVVLEKDHKNFKPVYSINIEKQAAYMQVNTAFKDAF